MKYNYHTHTKRCNHASGSDEAYILSAIKAGFDCIGMSDHIPFEGYKNQCDRMDDTELNEYIESMYLLKEKYKDQIDIKVGFEIEFFDEMVEYYQEVIKRVDYLIIGQHYKKMIDHDYSFQASDDDLEYYVSAIEKAVSLNLVKCIAHPDYFMLGRSNFSAKCAEVAVRLANLSLKYDIPLEINLNGIRYGKREYETGMFCCYPFYDFWKIISEKGCKVIYGYDAHTPECLEEEYRIDVIKEILQGLSFNILDKYVV